MKPQDWHVGMTVTLDGIFWVLVERWGDRPGCWHAFQPNDPESCMCDFSPVGGLEWQPATFGDLSRRPSDEPVGARAIVVDTGPKATDRRGKVFTHRGRNAWAGDGTTWYDPPPEWFAPLSAEEEATEVAHSDPDRCRGCGMLCDLCECPPTPAAPAEERCQGPMPIRVRPPDRCSVLWLAGDHTIDPCSACTPLIDAAEAVQDRCVHGWRLDSIDDGCPWCKGRLR